MDSQLHMAGEASQSWQKANEEQSHVLHGSRQERNESQVKGISPYKPSDLMRLIHYHENSMRETTTIIQLSSSGPALDMWVLLQFEVRFGWDTAKPYQMVVFLLQQSTKFTEGPQLGIKYKIYHVNFVRIFPKHN